MVNEDFLEKRHKFLKENYEFLYNEISYGKRFKKETKDWKMFISFLLYEDIYLEEDIKKTVEKTENFNKDSEILKLSFVSLFLNKCIKIENENTPVIKNIKKYVDYNNNKLKEEYKNIEKQNNIIKTTSKTLKKTRNKRN